MRSQGCHRLTCLAVACALAAATSSLALPTPARADGAAASQVSELQKKVEESAAAYEQATAKVADIQSQMDDNQAKVDAIEAKLPAQKQKCASMVRSEYKLQQDTPGILGLLLSSEDFNEFISNYQYLDSVKSYLDGETSELVDMEAQLADAKTSLQSQKAEADSERDAAEVALAAAQKARQEAQERAAAQAAAEAAAAQAAIEAAQQQAAAGQQPEGLYQSSNEASADATTSVASSDAVSWGTDRQAFVDQWQPRIDAYLSGSPLAGHGKAFAEAAWDYGVDPRWSPAISNTESSKGAACFLPHNAWGWGSSSWPDWDTAIRAHVQGLSEGYGYTISVAAAQKYCPPTWESWFAETLAEMESI